MHTKYFRFTSKRAIDLGTFARENGKSIGRLLTTGEFLHCFCRNCGVPLWVENDGNLDAPPLDVQFHQASGPGTTSVGVNIRAVNDINQSGLPDMRIKRYNFGDDKDACVLDHLAAKEIT